MREIEAGPTRRPTERHGAAAAVGNSTAGLSPPVASVSVGDGQVMNTDRPWRRFRLIEGRNDEDLEFDQLTKGWWATAEGMQPGSPKALVGSRTTVTLPGGARFREVSFKTEHEIMELALPIWSRAVGRRWAKVVGRELVVSDGSIWPLSAVKIDEQPQIDVEVGPDGLVPSLLRRVFGEEPIKAVDPTPGTAHRDSGGSSEG